MFVALILVVDTILFRPFCSQKYTLMFDYLEDFVTLQLYILRFKKNDSFLRRYIFYIHLMNVSLSFAEPEKWSDVRLWNDYIRVSLTKYTVIRVFIAQ
jgi:hypothetical protein